MHSLFLAPGGITPHLQVAKAVCCRNRLCFPSRICTLCYKAGERSPFYPINCPLAGAALTCPQPGCVRGGGLLRADKLEALLADFAHC